MFDLLIRDAIVVPIEPRGAAYIGHVGVNDGAISAVDAGGSAASGSVEIDASGLALLPGFVDGHIHPSPSIFRGSLNRLTIDENLADLFVSYVHAQMTDEEAEIAAHLTLAQARSGGTTSVGLMEYLKPAAAINAAADLRLFGTAAIYPTEDWEGHFEDARRAGLRPWLMGPNENHEDYSEPFLARLADLAQSVGVRVHMHVQETRHRVETIRSRLGVTPIRFLERVGLLESLYAAHCTVIEEEDIALLAERRVPVVVTPSSEAMLSDGVGPVRRMIDAGIEVGLGTDGAAWAGREDMFREMSMAGALSRAWDRSAALDALDLLEMATLGAARAMGVDDAVGSLVVGKRADLILVDVSRSHLSPVFLDARANIFDLLAFSAASADVNRVIIEGRIVTERPLQPPDPAVERFQEVAQRLLLGSSSGE